MSKVGQEHEAALAAIKHALVLGLGASGQAAARLLLARGVRVAVIDAGSSPELLMEAEVLAGEGATTSIGAALLPEGDFDLCVVSPGIAANSVWVCDARARGMHVVSELELGWLACECPLVAVTGSNGKSTMTKLCAEALERAGRRVAIGGNFGTPLCALAEKSVQLDWIVVEVSSFQLELVETFRPRVAVLLNIQPDHLDRHGTMVAYVETKARLFACMAGDDVGIVLDALGHVVPSPPHLPSTGWWTFGAGESAGYRYESGKIYLGAAGDKTLSVAGSPFDNPVMGLTAAAAAAVLEACGEDPGTLADAVQKFKPLKHRMTDIGSHGGVRFINDSKATNLSALSAALEMIDGPCRLIAGGQMKEKDLAIVKEVLASKVRAVYLMGDASVIMQNAWSDVVHCRMCGDLDGAVRAAWRDAVEGEVVLLSPGCASFDQFENYKDRGRQFERLVRMISEEEK